MQNMNKQQLLDAFSQFIDQMGMEKIGGDEFDEDGLTAQGQVPLWSQMDASLLGEGTGPIHSKESFIKRMRADAAQQGQMAQLDAYGMPRDDQAEEMMMNLGML